MDLHPSDFAAFYEAVHGRPPFPWQSRLADQVAASGWPDLLDLPTGVGKTSALDVAVFALALDADKAPAERTAPRRIVLVIDRRTVVDQGYTHAREIRRALEDSGAPVVREVAARLSSLSEGGAPLDVAILRGGMPRDDAWARSPVQPLVAVSTVDQVGSRLLFRGYGVSRRMRPVHAGLLGNDTLILLDEVHLSHPFAQTLEALQRYRSWRVEPLPDRFRVVHMSATPASGAGARVFRLDPADLDNEVLARRVRVSKPAECVEVKVSGAEDKRRNQLAAAAAALVRSHAARGRVVAVVVNRVATARHAFTLAKADPKLKDAEIHLLTGRMRPLDRRDLEEDLFDRIRSGRERNPEQPPIVVVSTQCIEAGADFDFDVLITECASIDALRQRFGRLNRLGDTEDARGFVLGRTDLSPGNDDPVYGKGIGATWEWLREQTTLDFGIEALSLPEGDALNELLAPRLDAPVLLPAHLDRWVQTTELPVPDPDVALWLHGEQRGEPDVRVVWRADLTEELIEHHQEEAFARVAACPPSSLEALSLPISAFRRWIAKQPPADMADVEGEVSEAPADERSDAQPRPFLAWRGEDSEASPRLRGGETVVVPASYGGLRDRGWDPDAAEPVRDRGDEANFYQRGRGILRLHPIVAQGWTTQNVEPPPQPAAEVDSEDEDDVQRVRSWLSAVADAGPPGWLERVVPSLLAETDTARGLRTVVLPAPDDAAAPYLALVGRRRIRTQALEATTEDDSASHLGFEVPLRDHMRGVGERAEGYARSCGLRPETARDVSLAARWHDAGKADPRFQQMLRGGSVLRTRIASEPIAKSAIPAGDARAREEARRRAGYPKGGGHELLSVALIEESALQSRASDWPLVLHLVGAHHGSCRPIAPFIDDPEPVQVEIALDGLELRARSAHGLHRLDSGVTERFWALNESYGWHGLAWLEAIVRLSDHRQSEEEQIGGSA